MVVYVDDMLLLASPRDTYSLWRDLEEGVQYKDPAAPLQRYLGVLYNFDAFDLKISNVPRSLLTSIDDYASNAMLRFKAEFRDKLTRMTSHYLATEEVGVEGYSSGRFSSSASSHVATCLFLSRDARLDISVAVQRLCRVVINWSTT